MWTCLLGAIAVLLSLALTGFAVEYFAETRDRRRFPPPGQLFVVNGHRLHLYSAGERRPGQPTIVLEAGMASWSFYWRLVQPEAAKFARVCAYDRAGLGWSDAAAGPRLPHQIAAELRALLRAAGESGPYVLVGHSLGGLYVRQFARLYPREVAGMVLVDSAHDDQLNRVPGARAEARSLALVFGLLAGLARLGVLRLVGRSLLARFTSVNTPEDRALFLATLLASRYFETTRAEALALLQPLAQEERLASFGEKPLVVIRAGGQPESFPNERARERWQVVRRAFDDIQQELLGLSANSRLVTAEGSVHNVQLEAPQVVVEAIRQVTEAAAAGEPRRDQPPGYAIRIKGRLDARWSEWFEGLTMTQTEADETILSGPVADQAALHGLLAKVRDLNLTLVSASRIDADEEQS